MEIINRPYYLNEVERQLGKGQIIVLTGQRRVGKSCLLKQLRQSLDGKAEANVIYIDMERREFGNLQAIADNYPKYVISLTPMVSHTDMDGITHLHLRRFLTEGFSGS